MKNYFDLTHIKEYLSFRLFNKNIWLIKINNNYKSTVLLCRLKTVSAYVGTSKIKTIRYLNASKTLIHPYCDYREIVKYKSSLSLKLT